MTTLDELRVEIDKLDKILVETIAKRFEIVKKIGKYKAENNIAPLALERWQTSIR